MENQHKLWLQLDSILQLGPCQHPGPKCHHVPGFQCRSQIIMNSVTSWPSNTNMASDGSLIPSNLHGVWRNQDSRTLTLTLAVAGPRAAGLWSQSWSSPYHGPVYNSVSIKPWSWWAVHVTHVCLSLAITWPSNNKFVAVGGPDSQHLWVLRWQYE